MATIRPFSYNTGSPIAGTIQVGDLAVGYPTTGYTGMEWWNGPDEDLGYVIAQPVPDDSQPTNVPEDEIFLSSTYKGVDISLTNNNQTASQIFSYQQTVLGETIISSGSRVMFSVKYTSSNPSVGVGGHFIGIGLTTMNYSGPFNGYPGNDTYSNGFSDDGKLYYNGSVYEPGLPTWTDGDVIDIAIDYDLEQWWIRVNGGFWNNVPQGDPATQTAGKSIQLTSPSGYYPALCPYIFGTIEVLNYPTYGVPSGGFMEYNFLGKKTGSVGFFRTDGFDDNEFIDIANILLNSNYNNAPDASTGLTSSGYWNSYLTPILSLDAGNPLSYPGTGTVWTDLIGGKVFNLFNGVTYETNNGGRLNFNSSNANYAICNTSLPSLSTWTVGVWHYYTGSETGSGPCIVTETFIGGGINYSIGNNNGPFSAGFFDGGWEVTDGYSLTPGNWYYIVGTYDGSTINLYVNNTLVDTTNYTGTPTSSGAGIRLMERWDLADYWDGYLSIVNIYGEALNQSQITSYWNSTKSRFGL